MLNVIVNDSVFIHELKNAHNNKYLRYTYLLT